MGLHRDPSEYGLGPVECHVRRMIWYQLCFLDIRTCEAQGPRPGIRDDEFDTRLPLNINDNELSLLAGTDSPPPDSVDYWTDMTLTLIRMECVELHRHIWVDRPRLEQKQTNLTTVLGKIENTKRSLMKNYFSPAAGYNENIPMHRAGRLISVVMITRAQAMVLHRYHNSVMYTVPDRLRQIIITSGIECLEASVQLETDPALLLWSWYHGAIQQYHTALLLMLEIFAFPYRKEADRIWACLDYIFEIPQGISREQKGRWVMTQVRDRVAFLMANKRVKVPQAMIDKMGGTGGQSSPGLPSPNANQSRSHHQRNTSQTQAQARSDAQQARQSKSKSSSLSPPQSYGGTPASSNGTAFSSNNGAGVVGKMRSVETTSGEGIYNSPDPSPRSGMAYPMTPTAQYIVPPVTSAPALPPQQRMPMPTTSVAPAAPAARTSMTSAPATQGGNQAMIDIDWVSFMSHFSFHN